MGLCQQEGISEFEVSIRDMQGLLTKSGLPGRIFWILPQDIIYTHRKFFLLTRSADCRLTAVRNCYRTAREKGSGVRIMLISHDTDYAYCYLYVPHTIYDEERTLTPRGRVVMAIPARIIGMTRISPWNPIGMVLRLRELGLLRWKRSIFIAD